MTVQVVPAVAYPWEEAAPTPMTVAEALEMALVLAVAEASGVALAPLVAALPPSKAPSTHSPAGRATGTEVLVTRAFL